VNVPITAIDVSHVDVFDALVYPEQHSGVQQYIQAQFQQVGHNLNSAAAQYIESARLLSEQFYDSAAAMAARAAVRMIGHIVNPNVVQHLRTLEDLQCAAPVMQRYIMADPYIRQKYLEQLCSGYDGQYMNADGSDVGEQHYDWRRVHQGIAEVDEKGWQCVQYFEDLRDGDRELAIDEQVDIIGTMELARLFAQAGEDPTDPFGGNIG